MSVSVDFYKFSKKRNSTKQPTGAGTTFNCEFKSGTSFLSPTLLLSNSAKPDYNYFVMDGWYYFISDIVSVRNDLWEIYGKVDPMATAKTAILAGTQFVSYSSSKTSIWLQDGRVPILSSAIDNKNTTLTGILSTIGTYILSTVGASSCSTYAFNSYYPIADLLDDIASWEDAAILAAKNITASVAGQADPTTSYDADASSNDPEGIGKSISKTIASLGFGIAGTLINQGKAITDSIKTIGEAMVQTGFLGNGYTNMPQCIRSCIWVPFDFSMMPAGTGASPIRLGRQVTNTNAAAIAPTPVTATATISIPWHYSDWRRAACEEVYLHLPLVGMVQLSSDELVNVSSLTITTSVTYTDGNICYKVTAGDQVIGTYGAQCAVNYPIGMAQQASAGEIFQSYIGGIQKALTNAVSAATSLNPVGMAVGAAASALQGPITAYEVADKMLTSHVSCVGSIGGGAGLGLGRDIVCYTVTHETAYNPDDLQQTMGLPTMKPMALATLTGYCECTNAHVEADFPAPILDAVDTYLNSGFFIE